MCLFKLNVYLHVLLPEAGLSVWVSYSHFLGVMGFPFSFISSFSRLLVDIEMRVALSLCGKASVSFGGLELFGSRSARVGLNGSVACLCSRQV